jgi:hypothetical protein
MERLELDDILPALKKVGCDIDTESLVYYVGRESIVRAAPVKRLPWGPTKRLFASMERNQAHLINVLGLPSDRVIELGRRIELEDADSPPVLAKSDTSYVSECGPETFHFEGEIEGTFPAYCRSESVKRRLVNEAHSHLWRCNHRSVYCGDCAGRSNRQPRGGPGRR